MSKPTKTKKARWWIILTLFLLGLIILLAVMIITPGVQASSKANTAQSDITTLVAGIKNSRPRDSDQGQYSTLSVQSLLRLRVPPASMIDGEYDSLERTILDSGWGAVHIFPVSKQMQREPPYDLFVIGYEQVPTSDCIKLVSGLTRNFHAVFVGTQPRPAENNAQLIKDPGVITKQCASGGAVYVDFVSH